LFNFAFINQQLFKLVWPFYEGLIFSGFMHASYNFMYRCERNFASF